MIAHWLLAFWTLGIIASAIVAVLHWRQWRPQFRVGPTEVTLRPGVSWSRADVERALRSIADALDADQVVQLAVATPSIRSATIADALDVHLVVVAANEKAELREGVNGETRPVPQLLLWTRPGIVVRALDADPLHSALSHEICEHRIPLVLGLGANAEHLTAWRELRKRVDARV